ncbi:hypothetical protein RDI58_013291 [Solanum bulbocastanum]|uniref:Uncharacterized protein n=1 Tax=Solanum bulbocastanum TaxID=147425 RepID=A0AAN8YF35_SOLBU
MVAARLYAVEKAAEDIYLKRGISLGSAHNLLSHALQKDEDIVWDVISNEEAIEIVSEIPDRAKTAQHLVQCVVRAWKCVAKKSAQENKKAKATLLHHVDKEIKAYNCATQAAISDGYEIGNANVDLYS